MPNRLTLLVLLCCAPLLAQEASPAYRLGPGDEVTLHVLDLEEIGDKPFRLDSNGEITVPLAGRLQAGGLTTRQMEAELTKRLQTYLRAPQVVVSVTQFRSQPVSVLGAVNTPGVFQIEAGKTLYQALSLAGGLRPDAGALIRITRRKSEGPIPLPGAEPDTSGEFNVAQVSVASVMDARNPAGNITVRPNDVISVPVTEVVYVVGSVHKPGGFALGQNESLSVLQAVAKAEGLDKEAVPKRARILRNVLRGAPQAEVAINVKAMLAGQAPDVPLGPNDILFIPAATGLRNAAAKATEIAASAAAYRLIWF
jgi:polysaccharide export outer membrane protein